MPNYPVSWIFLISDLIKDHTWCVAIMSLWSLLIWNSFLLFWQGIIYDTYFFGGRHCAFRIWFPNLRLNPRRWQWKPRILITGPPRELLDVDIFGLSSIQSLSRVRHFGTPWTAALQASLSITNSRSLFKLMSIESIMLSNHLVLCHPLLLPPSIFPNIRVFSSESVVCIRWPKYWRFSFSINPSNEYSGLISFRSDWISFNYGKIIALIIWTFVGKVKKWSHSAVSDSLWHLFLICCLALS